MSAVGCERWHKIRFILATLITRMSPNPRRIRGGKTDESRENKNIFGLLLKISPTPVFSTSKAVIYDASQKRKSSLNVGFTDCQCGLPHRMKLLCYCYLNAGDTYWIYCCYCCCRLYYFCYVAASGTFPPLRVGVVAKAWVHLDDAAILFPM